MVPGGAGGSGYLVRVDGHARRQTDHRDSVEAGGVGDRCRSQVVVRLRRVTDQDRIHLQREEEEEEEEETLTGL